MTLPVLGLLGFYLCVRFVCHQNPNGAVQECHRRHRKQSANDPGQHRARGDGQHHSQRVDRYRAAHHEWLQHVTLQLLDSDDQREGDQRVDPTLGEQCDDDGEEAGHHRTDQRDERAEEHQRGQRQC